MKPEIKVLLWVFLLHVFPGLVAVTLAQNKLLLVGDSHTVMSFGSLLANKLGEKYEVHRYGVPGFAAQDWMRDEQNPVCPAPPSSGPDKCPSFYRACFFAKNGFNNPQPARLPADYPGFSALEKTYKGATLVIGLGTNDAGAFCKMVNQPQQAMRSILDMFGSIPPGQTCFWVGPPVYADQDPTYKTCGPNYDKYVDLLQKTVEQPGNTSEGCKFIDSRKILDPSTQKPIRANVSDHIHFTGKLADVWASAVATQILGSGK